MTDAIPKYHQRKGREQVANNARRYEVTSEYKSINAAKAEEEISEEEALADLRNMREMQIVNEDQLPANNKERSRNMSESWADPNVAEARTTRHRVFVNVYKGDSIDENNRLKGEEYRSTQQAFNALGLPKSKAVRFRLKLKELGKLAFDYGGKLYAFELLSRNAIAGKKEGKA